ncbi:acyltransferase domain-containing protein [Streptomyces typhae]|uniref:acyltransferase domain-containing protein n=1 Tax=Streptomyces typhae TaxID=2681492 RepID=UPI003CCDC38E
MSDTALSNTSACTGVSCVLGFCGFSGFSGFFGPVGTARSYRGAGPPRTYGGPADVRVDCEWALSKLQERCLEPSARPGDASVSGEPAVLDGLVVTCGTEGMRVRRIPVDCAFHSAQVDRIVGRLEQELAGLSPRPARLPVYSTAEAAWTALSTPTLCVRPARCVPGVPGEVLEDHEGRDATAPDGSLVPATDT